MAFEIDRRSMLTGMGAIGLTGGCARALANPPTPVPGPAPGIAITIDDFDLSDTALMTGDERDAAILSSLRHHGTKAAGFVAGKYVDPVLAPRVLGRWSDAGHVIGNHSFSHRYFSGADPDALIADILKCEPLISGYRGFRKLFRFPYLAEGKTAEGRDAMRALLRQHGYRNAPVTIDTSDWFIDNRLKARLKSDPRAEIGAYRQFYLDHLWERATFYDGLAKSLFGRSIDHTILLHHRLTTGLYLGDALSMFRERGWRLIDATSAFASKELALEPPTLPAGQSLLWAMAKADERFDAVLRYPGEDGAYEEPKMDALGL